MCAEPRLFNSTTSRKNPALPNAAVVSEVDCVMVKWDYHK